MIDDMIKEYEYMDQPLKFPQKQGSSSITPITDDSIFLKSTKRLTTKSKSLKQPCLLLTVPKSIKQFHLPLTLEPILKPIISMKPLPIHYPQRTHILRKSITEMKDIMMTDRNNVFKETNHQ